MKLQILLSTMDERLLKIDFNNSYNYLIIHQITDGKEEEYQNYINKMNSNIKYIQSFTTGLSKSRNLALDNSRGDILWIMDDDTVILDGCYNKVVSYFQDYDFLSINYVSNLAELSNVSEKKLNLFNSGDVSSIKMLLSRKVVESNIRFDEDFGLGTKNPSGEEYIFISELLKHKFKGYAINQVGCIHPEDSSGKVFYSTSELLKTKFLMFDKVFGSFGIIFSSLFIFKKFFVLFKNKSILKCIRVFIVHYFLGK